MATNLGKNLDAAFARRMQYIVEFPLPNARARERLWRGLFSSQAPLGGRCRFSVPCRPVLVGRRRYPKRGALGGILGRPERLARLVVTKGKVPSPAEFKQYRV